MASGSRILATINGQSPRLLRLEQAYKTSLGDGIIGANSFLGKVMVGCAAGDQLYYEDRSEKLKITILEVK